MARRAVSYDTVTIARPAETPEPEAPPAPIDQPETEYLINLAHQVVIYLAPAAHKTLSRYALEQSEHRKKVRVHDLLITAVEEFFERNGLPGPVRAKEPIRGRGPKRALRVSA